MNECSTHMIESGVQRAGSPSVNARVTSSGLLSTRNFDLEGSNGLSQRMEISMLMKAYNYQAPKARLVIKQVNSQAKRKQNQTRAGCPS